MVARVAAAAMLMLLVAASATSSAAGQNTCGANSQCQRPLCAVIRCIAGTSCKEFCNNCTASCVPDPSTAASSGGGSATCPPGVPTVNCLVAPCSLKGACGKDETCTDSYCGGCKAICTKKDDPKICPNGKPPAKCEYDPCIAATCLAPSRCEANPCGASGCEAKCIPIAPQPGGGSATCPPGVPTVKCLVAPCSVKGACGKDETCTDSYCGSCKAICTKKEDPKLCPNGKPPAKCQYDPCIAALCPAPSRCEANRCGANGCEAKCIPIAPQPPKTCPNGKRPADCTGTSPCAALLCAPGRRCEADPCARSGKCEGKCVPLCPGGSIWNSSVQSTGCQKCPAGTYSRVDDQNNRCVKCKRGTYAAAGSAACRPCPVDTYARRDGSASCTACPAFMTTHSKRGQSACSPRNHGGSG